MIGKGFAFVSPEGDLLINTVSCSKRAAKVNSVYVITQGCVMPLRHWSDEKLDSAFETYCGLGHLVEVTIQAHEG